MSLNFVDLLKNSEEVTNSIKHFQFELTDKYNKINNNSNIIIQKIDNLKQCIGGNANHSGNNLLSELDQIKSLTIGIKDIMKNNIDTPDFTHKKLVEWLKIILFVLPFLGFFVAIYLSFVDKTNTTSTEYIKVIILPYFSVLLGYMFSVTLLSEFDRISNKVKVKFYSIAIFFLLLFIIYSTFIFNKP